MLDVKHVLLSKSVWGSIVAIVATAVSLLGYHVTAADQAQILDQVNQLIDIVAQVTAIGGALFAIYGRIVATKTLTVSTTKPPVDPNEGGH